MSASNCSTDTAPSPNSPTKSMSIPSRATGHRRGGSEFIGGDGKAGGPGLMSTSPTKGEGVLPTPQTSRLGPPAGRRGHAHRRSGAISSQDISSVLKLSIDISGTRSGSAPTTPCDPVEHQHVLPTLDRSASQPVLPCSTPSSTMPTARRESPSNTSQPRARVGFSDTVEFIPRPLSTISSETSSSVSTFLANHSVAGSISSIISAGTSSPPSAQKATRSPRTSFEHDVSKTRPKTAGAVMGGSYNTLPFFRSEEARQRPSSATASPVIATRDENAAALLLGKVILQDNSHTDDVSPKSTPLDEEAEISYPRTCSSKNSIPRMDGEPKSSIRQKKVKSWAESILLKKGKRHTVDENPNNRPSSSIARGQGITSDDFSLQDIDFDDDTTWVIQTPQDDVLQAARIRTDFSNWQPREQSPSIHCDSFSPMLDLDAALGPFNTPTLNPTLDQNRASGFFTAKRRMHSSGATGGFTGPGMHYHRRAESAPEMAPINLQMFGLHRPGSNSTMADVFEEDEEDEEASAEKRSHNITTPKIALGQGRQGDILGLGVHVIDADVSDHGVVSHNTHSIGDTSFAKDNSQVASHLQNERSTSCLVSEPLPEYLNDVEIVDAEEEPRFSMMTKSSNESTISPTLSSDQLIARPSSTQMAVISPRPGFYVETPETTSSVVSSPDFSNTSFDVPRLNTARSSITDRVTMSSSRTGDFGQDLRVSVDDVPSLTSSASTMISAHPPRYSSSAGTRYSGERSSSLSAAVPARTRPVSAGKRSSLVSLSRLVGSSYGEKSKLSIEERAQADEIDRPERRKGNRISRLMRFWKSKERLSSA